jgi:hypothetical protein
MFNAVVERPKANLCISENFVVFCYRNLHYIQERQKSALSDCFFSYNVR